MTRLRSVTCSLPRGAHRRTLYTGLSSSLPSQFPALDLPFLPSSRPAPPSPSRLHPPTQYQPQSQQQGHNTSTGHQQPLATLSTQLDAGTVNSSHPFLPTSPPPAFGLFPHSHFGPVPPVYSSSAHPTSSKSKSYQLQTGAYGIAKQRPRPVPQTTDDLGLAVQVGEDAYFIRSDALGVADGVGGWAKSSCPSSSSALFSRHLMHSCSQLLEPSLPSVDPVDILQSAYETTLDVSNKQGLTHGSSTALLAILRDQELRIAHLGDCCALLVRGEKVVWRSEEMQHSFNYPLQLGPLSQTTPAEHAQRITVPIQHNDILILSTDGMSDNLWEEDVEDEVARFAPRPSSSPEFLSPFEPSPFSNPFEFSKSNMRFNPPSRFKLHLKTGTTSSALPASLAATLSQALCSRAKKVSECKQERATLTNDNEGETPFGRKAKAEGMSFVGGKSDDITVIVAVISSAPEGYR